MITHSFKILIVLISFVLVTDVFSAAGGCNAFEDVIMKRVNGSDDVLLSFDDISKNVVEQTKPYVPFKKPLAARDISFKDRQSLSLENKRELKKNIERPGYSTKVGKRIIERRSKKRTRTVRRYDGARKEIENIDMLLGQKKIYFLNKYNRLNTYNISNERDRVYFSGIADMLETKFRNKNMSKKMVELNTRKRLRNIMRECKAK